MKKYVIFVSIFIIVLISLMAFLLYPRLQLTKQYVELNVNTKYKEPGYKAFNVFKNYNKKVKIKNKVNMKKLGNYTVKYSYKFAFIKRTKVRTVKVVDKEKPVIKLEYEDEEICKNKYKEYKYSAHDNYDGDLTDKVEVEITSNKMIYVVKDSSGNESVKTKRITIKTENEPNIKLKGKDKITLYKGYDYKEPGYEASDECDGDLTDKVKVEGSVNKNKVGTYELTYSIFNSNEKKKEIKRKVIIVDKPSPKEASNGNGKVVYLTFDDGPGLYTKSILDTLSKYNVKATFFVTNQFPGYQNLITEEHNRGHAVAVHTYTHSYSVYDSVDAYIDDFNKMNDIIEQRTGTRSKIFRFPGGSSNTVSRKHQVGVVTAIASEMTNRGYVYYDWHVSSGDAAGANANGIYNNVINGVSKCGSSCVVLMHDIKGTTASALDSILKELTSKGYSFGTLNESVPAVHHKINT